jgi:hypothetical protein
MGTPEQPEWCADFIVRTGGPGLGGGPHAFPARNREIRACGLAPGQVPRLTPRDRDPRDYSYPSLRPAGNTSLRVHMTHVV